jgi:hypothetical protein
MSRRKKIDGRSKAARRYQELIAAFASDLGGDLSAAEQALVKQAALVTLQAENVQDAVMNGSLEDTDKLTRLINSGCRILTALNAARGKHRRTKRIDMDAYLDGAVNEQTEEET